MAVAVAVVFALVLGSQIYTSAVRYRRMMRREWPNVEPLTDDDD